MVKRFSSRSRFHPTRPPGRGSSWTAPTSWVPSHQWWDGELYNQPSNRWRAASRPHIRANTKDASSTSFAFAQTVHQVSTSTALSVDVNPAPAGQTVNFTAMVSPTVATGSVQFVDFFKGAQTVLGTVPLSAGVAVLPIALPSGTQAITAVYSGDANHTTSASALLMEIVNRCLGRFDTEMRLIRLAVLEE